LVNSALGRGLLAMAGLGAAGLVIAHSVPGVSAIGPVRRRFFPALAGQGKAGHIALTFDDGPDSVTTPRFLAALDDCGVRATFFMLGPMAAASPGLAAEIAAAGHEIGLHGWDHRYATLRSPRAIYDDLSRALDVVSEVTGAIPRFYRPPYGVLTAGALRAARTLNLRPVLWTCWGREWAPEATPASVYETLARDLADGGTVLLHDSDCTSPLGAAESALGALGRLIDDCGRRGLAVGTLAAHGLRTR
jgi:peptidoglycan/xylan/chitin deacetylase (PgdA/CDA1 family)